MPTDPLTIAAMVLIAFFVAVLDLALLLTHSEATISAWVRRQAAKYPVLTGLILGFLFGCLIGHLFL